jgi:hypothetical protein
MERAAPELAKLSAADAAAISERIEFATSAAMRGAIFAINTFLFALILGLAYALIFRAAVRRDATASKKSA